MRKTLTLYASALDTPDEAVRAMLNDLEGVKPLLDEFSDVVLVFFLLLLTCMHGTAMSR